MVSLKFVGSNEFFARMENILTFQPQILTMIMCKPTAPKHSLRHEMIHMVLTSITRKSLCIFNFNIPLKYWFLGAGKPAAFPKTLNLYFRPKWFHCIRRFHFSGTVQQKFNHLSSNFENNSKRLTAFNPFSPPEYSLFACKRSSSLKSVCNGFVCSVTWLSVIQNKPVFQGFQGIDRDHAGAKYRKRSKLQGHLPTTFKSILILLWNQRNLRLQTENSSLSLEQWELPTNSLSILVLKGK